MNNILQLCLCVNGMKEYSPFYDAASNMILNPTKDMYNCYWIHNGIIAFVTKEGKYYVSPYYKDVEKELLKNGYFHNGIFVPFSTGDEPLNKKDAKKWRLLCNEAINHYNKMANKEMKYYYRGISDRKQIKALNDSVYKMSLHIPDEGISVMNYKKDRWTFQILKYKLPDLVGTYNTNNGITLFIDNNGKSFVTPAYSKIINILENANYKKLDYKVPLSTGEYPFDKDVYKKWNKLCEDARY